MRVDPNTIQPSQNFLKEKTVKYILQCFRDNRLDELPPPPLVREDGLGQLVAIDGHNLLAVCAFKGLPAEVIVVTSSEPIFPEISEANITRNSELKAKYDQVLADAAQVREEGITDFMILVAKYPELFTEPQ